MTVGEIVATVIGCIGLVFSVAVSIYTLVNAKYTVPRGKIDKIVYCLYDDSGELGISFVIYNTSYYNLSCSSASLTCNEISIDGHSYNGDNEFEALLIDIPAFSRKQVDIYFDVSPIKDIIENSTVTLSIRLGKKIKSTSFTLTDYLKD